MPGKHVHFDLEEEYAPEYFEYSPEPSPTFSTSSLPSSDGPITPPPLGSGSPYQHKPLPELEAIMLHPTVARGEPNAFNYDLTVRPIKNVNIQHPTYTIADSFWDQPVTQPPVPFMEVECALLPWKVTITPSRYDQFPYITFHDLFTTIYASLRKQVTKAEYDQVKVPQHRYHIENAYRRRYKRMSDYAEYEKERDTGLRRVDFLGEYILFGGISCNTNGRAQWTLHVLRPAPVHLS